MKKLMFGIAGVIAIVVSASAVDTAQIKAACEASDKTLWVERNQVCIPRNPCKDSKFESYCNRMFADVELNELGYKVLVEAYARTHNLSCMPVDTKSKLVGQDYVICMGDDVMVFEFDDISEQNMYGFDNGKSYMKELYPYICKAIGGQSGADNNKACYGTTESNCLQLISVLQKYGVDGFYSRWEKDFCRLDVERTDWQIDSNIDGEVKYF